MKILQLGKAKSGNFWIYKIIQDILKQANVENKKFITQTKQYKKIKAEKLSTKEQNEKDVIDINDDGIYFRISSIFKKKILDFDEYINNVSHVWSHSKVSTNSDYVIKKFDKVVYIVRDPRDVMLSYSNFILTDYMKKYYPNKWESSQQYVKYNLISSSIDWVKHVVPYINKDYKNMYMIFYERFLINFEEELDKLLAYLELDLNSTSKKIIIDNAKAENMMKKNPHHVNKPKNYKWKDSLTRDQNEKFIKYCSSTIKTLGYDLKNNKNQVLPKLSNKRIFDDINCDFECFFEKIKRKIFLIIKN